MAELSLFTDPTPATTTVDAGAAAPDLREASTSPTTSTDKSTTPGRRLDPNVTPKPTAAAHEGGPTSSRRPGPHEKPTSTTTPPSGERSAARQPDRPDAPTSPAVPPAGAAVRHEPSREYHAPSSPTSDRTNGAPARGEPSGEYLRDLLDALVVGLRGLGGVRVEECLRLVGRCESRLAAVKAEKVEELARWRGEAHAADVLRDELKQSRGGAKREVEFAERLADLPGTAEALADGAITPQHARAIANASAHTPVDEAALLAAAENEPADVFGHTVRDHVNERTATEGLEERRRRQRARREANIKQESDGMYKLFGTFDPVAGARIETALAAMAKRLWHDEDPKGRSTPAQRYADALEALITRQGTGGAGEPQRTTLLVIADYDSVAGQLDDPRLVDGTPLAPSEFLKIALEADILPALFGTKGQPLWLGHKYRHASTAQRIALAVRDRGCVVCGAPNSFCQAHHVIFWEDGGPTDIDNLVLLCSDCHHHKIHGLGADLIRHPDGTYSLKPPPNQPPNPRRRNGKARHGKPRHGKAHHGERGSPERHSHRAGTGGTINQPLQR